MPNNTTKKYLFQYTNPAGNVAVKQGDIEEMKKLQAAGTLLKAGPVTEANIRAWAGEPAAPTPTPTPTPPGHIPPPGAKPLFGPGAEPTIPKPKPEKIVGDLGFPKDWREYQEWIRMGRVFKEGRWQEPTTPAVPKPKPDLEAAEVGIARVRERVEALKPKVAEEVARRAELEPLPPKEPTPIIEELGLDKEEEVIRTGDDIAEKQKQQQRLLDIAEQMTEDKTEVERLTTQQQLRNLREELGLDPETGEKLERPVIPTYASDFEALRSEHGVAAIETQLTTLNKEIADTEASLRLGLYAEEAELKPMELIGATQRELQRQAQEQLDALNRRKAVLLDEYNTKANLINNLMTYKRMDYATAVADYDAKFNQQIQLLNILEKRETREQQEANMEMDDAKANWQVLSGMIEDQLRTGDIGSYDELSEELKLEIKKLEMKGGLPTGFTEQVLGSVSPEKTVNTKIISKDKTQISIIYDDGTIEVFSTGLTAEVEEPELLSVSEAEKLGLPYGTTKAQAAAMGITPEREPEAVFKTETGVSLDLGSVEGIKQAAAQGYSYADIYAALDENTKLTTGSIKNLLSEAGMESPEEVKEREKEEKPFLTTDYFKRLYTTVDSMLKVLGKERSEYAKWLKTKKQEEEQIKKDFNDYVNNTLMPTILEYKKAGYTDREILKMMK